VRALGWAWYAARGNCSTSRWPTVPCRVPRAALVVWNPCPADSPMFVSLTQFVAERRRTPRPGHYPVNFSPFIMKAQGAQHSPVMLSHRCALNMHFVARREFPALACSPKSGMNKLTFGIILMKF